MFPSVSRCDRFLFFFCAKCVMHFTHEENCEPRYENFCHERRRRALLKCCPFLHSKRALLSRRSHFISMMVRHCFSVDFRCHETLVDVDENGLSCGFKPATHPWIISSDILLIPFFLFLFPPGLWIKIIIVCSMKFLPHFPPLMIILFKVYQLENILCNLNANDSGKYVWGET